MNSDIKTAKVLFHEALEALSLHVGDETKKIYIYEVKHINNALVVGVDGGWASIRSAISALDLFKMAPEFNYSMGTDLLTMIYTLSDYMKANKMNMMYRVHGDTEDSFVWAYNNYVYIGSRPDNARTITELSPIDFYELMEQAGVCLVGYYDGPTGRVGEYAIVSKQAD